MKKEEYIEILNKISDDVLNEIIRRSKRVKKTKRIEYIYTKYLRTMSVIGMIMGDIMARNILKEVRK